MPKPIQERNQLQSDAEKIAKAQQQLAAHSKLSSILDSFLGKSDSEKATGLTSLAAPSPIGDIAGIVNDVQKYRSGEEELTPLNGILTALGALPGIPAGLGIVVNAKRAKSLDAVHEFEKAEKKGEDADILEQITGIWRGGDGKLRTEISDLSAKLNADKIDRNSYDSDMLSMVTPGERLEDVLDHPELYKILPELRAVNTAFVPGLGGFYNRNYDEMGVGLMPVKNVEVPQNKMSTSNSTRTDSGMLFTLIHELQHAAQSKSGFAGGGNPELFEALGISPKEADKLYDRIAGEVEANTAAMRAVNAIKGKSNYGLSFKQEQDLMVPSDQLIYRIPRR